MNLYDPCSETCVARVEWWAEVDSKVFFYDGFTEPKPFTHFHHGAFGIPEHVGEEEWSGWALRFVGYMFQQEPKNVKLRITRFS